MHSTGEAVRAFESGLDPYKEQWLSRTGTPSYLYRKALGPFKTFCYYTKEAKKSADRICDDELCECPCHVAKLPEGLI